MVWTHLLSPDEPDTPSGGGATDAQTQPGPSADVGTADSPAPPASTQPAGVSVSQEEYEALRRSQDKAKEADRFFGQIKQLGFDSTADAIPALERLRALERDPTTRGIVNALMQPPASPQTSQDIPQVDLTPDSVRDLVRNELTQYSQKQLDDRFRSDQEKEVALLEKAIRDPKIGKVFGDDSFQDALDGKAKNPAAKAVAELLASEIYSRSPQINNRAFPVTDANAVNEALDSVVSQLNAVRAAAILEASSDSSDLSRPDSSSPVKPEPKDDTPLARRADDDRQRMSDARKTFEDAMRQGQLASEGQPASRLVSGGSAG